MIQDTMYGGVGDVKIPKWFLMGPLLIIALAIVATWGVHATKKHGVADVTMARECLMNDQIHSTWITRSNKPWNKGKHFFLCELPDGRISLSVMIRKADGTWREKTTFVFDNMARAIEYVSGKAVRITGQSTMIITIKP